MAVTRKREQQNKKDHSAQAVNNKGNPTPAIGEKNITCAGADRSRADFEPAAAA